MKVELLDSTIREGEQSPNVSFTVEQKLEIVKLLDEFGVEFIELGHPAVSPDVREAVERLARLDTRANKMVHGRALARDIDDAANLNVPWVGIFFGTSPLSLEYKFQITPQKALVRISEAIRYAKDKGLKVRFTAEDATRTDTDFLVEVASVAEEAGADRFSIADTVGTTHPASLRKLVRAVASSVSIPLHVHCHNDYGLATANVLAGLEGGARLADVTVNGLGERSGISALSEVAVTLKMLYKVDNPWNLELLPKLSRVVERASGIFNSENRPIVGLYAFTHKAGLHTRAVLKDPRTYEAFPPELIKRHREITIDKYTGRDAVRSRLETMGVKLNDDQLNEIIEIIKSQPTKRHFSDMDLLDIVDDVLGLEMRARVPIDVEAIVNMELNSALYTTRVTRRLMGYPYVQDVYEITGEFDIVAHIKTKSIAELNEFIEELRVSEGVERTTTRLILKGYSRDFEHENKTSEDK
ncbi:MAG: homocitrate synthase [FCB group bacterium]|nr:homocitrate synthase [FCB group bacterium]